MPKFDVSSPLTVVAIAAVLLLAACGSAPAGEPSAAASAVDSEGLASIRSKAFDTAQVRPDTNFSTYKSIVLHPPELAYRAGDSAADETSLTEEQKALFRDALAAAFEREFAGLTQLSLTDTPGPGTLALHVRVRNIAVRVAPRPVGRSGRAAALLEASGDAEIVVELRDSQSNVILARGVDKATARGAAMRSGDDVKTRFEATGKVADDWARVTRNGVEALIAHGS